MLPHDELGTGPAVVLLHAGVADRTMWTEHLQPLAEAGYRAIAVDLPGYGEAAIEPGEQAAWLDVLAAMDGLEIERATLVGSSFGAQVALRSAFVAPGRVTAMALFSADAPALEPSPELKVIWEREESALKRGDIDAAVASVVESWTLPGASAELREGVAAMQRRAFELQAQARGITDAPDPVEEDPDVLYGLEVPTLVASGEHDLSDFRRGAEELARVLPRAQLAVIEDAGHLAPLEQPAAFRRLLLDFLP